MKNDYLEANRIARYILSVMSCKRLAGHGEENCQQEVGDGGLAEQAEAFDRWVRKNHSAIRELNRLSDEKQWEQVLTVNIAECTGRFEQLPIIEDAEIMRNILYSGVWIRYENAKARRENK